MLPSLEDTIDAVMPDWPMLSPVARAAAFAHCVDFVRAQLCLAPFHVRAGFRVLFVAYRLYALLHAGPYPSRSSRAAALTAFSALPFPMVEGLERILRSMSLLVFFEDPDVLAALGEDSPAMRQAVFRAKRAAAQGGAS